MQILQPMNYENAVCYYLINYVCSTADKSEFMSELL